MYINPRRVFVRSLGALAAMAWIGNAAAELETGYLEYGGLRCYVARARDIAAKSPVLLVIHGERGLDAQMEQVARRAALEGFSAVAPDLLFPDGGTPKDEGRAREMIAALDSGQTLTNLLAIVEDLAARPESGKLGCIGYYWGGGMAHQLAVRRPAIVDASPLLRADDERAWTRTMAFLKDALR